MAVTNTTSITGPYFPNGATTVFAFDFKAGSAGEIGVYRDLASGWFLVPSGSYTAFVDPEQEGGTIEFSVAPASGSGNIYIVSDPLFTREGQYTGEGPFTPKGLNNQFDKAAVRDIALKAEVGRAFKVPLGETGGDYPRADQRANKFLSFDADGDPLMSSGTGSDAGLREDLASIGGADLIGTSNGRTVQDYIDGDKLEIAIVSDTQPVDTPDQRAALISFWQDVASEKCDLTFMIGDLVDKGNEGLAAGVNWDDFFDAVYSSGIDPTTLFYLGGNHDRSFSEIEVEGTNRMLGHFYQRTRRPPVWALENGNNVFIFAGYHSTNLAQNMAEAVFEQLERLCHVYWKTHNIFIHVHAPLANSGLFRSTEAGFQNKPTTRWAALLDTYPIDVVFAGHNALDIISADEITEITYGTSTNSSGFVTHHILTGPHMEQRAAVPAYRFGSRKAIFAYGSNQLTVRMRDHDNAAWIDEKELTIALRFPALFGKQMREVGYNSASFAPFDTATRRVVIGLTDGNNTGTNTVDTRKLFDKATWIDAFGGDVPSTAEFLQEVQLPGGYVADASYDNNGNNVGGKVLYGARKLNSDDVDKESGFIIYATNPDGTEREVLRPYPGGKHVTKGDVYFTADKFPMWKATKTDSTARQADGYITGYGSAAYDDFLQFDPTTGLITCTHPGVYLVDGFFNFIGGDNVDDLVSLAYRRNRGGTETSFDVIEIQLKKAGANDRQPISLPPGMIGLLAGDTLGLYISGWASGSTVTIARVMFRGTLIRVG